MSPIEPIVSAQEPLPPGYGFLRKGNPFMTALCRRKTHAAHKALYVVRDKRDIVGLRAPKWILSEVYQEERESRLRRQANVEKRDSGMENEFRGAIERMFPNVPPEDLTKIIKRATKKRSGRVGRTAKLTLGEKVRLAVAAHIRHCHTPYERILGKTKDRAGARKTVLPQVNKLMEEWGWRDADGRSGMSGKKRRDVAQRAAPATRAGRTHRSPACSAPRPMPRREATAVSNGASSKAGASPQNAIEISDSCAETDTDSDQPSWDEDSEADSGDREWILIEDSDE